MWFDLTNVPRQAAHKKSRQVIRVTTASSRQLTPSSASVTPYTYTHHTTASSREATPSSASVIPYTYTHTTHAMSEQFPLWCGNFAICYTLVTCYSVYSRHLFFGGGELSPSSQSPQMAAKLRALNLFWPVQCYKYITETFFKWTINTGNHSSLSNQKAANLCLKCTKIRLAAGLCPDALRSLCAPLDL